MRPFPPVSVGPFQKAYGAAFTHRDITSQLTFLENHVGFQVMDMVQTSIFTSHDVAVRKYDANLFRT
jgi:hypothetical protein